ncbi:DNA repair protein RecO [candidate division CSSED10-310 bacterium]|uniref:DNA repair protein RecO n=1 Tax=candidate division CSSED10-310 bacterium TaxID=2855610 RepID=A0ABV6Z5P7_UNCC1
MSFRQTDAIVLRLFNYGEADRVAHFLTEDRGIVHGFVQGARRLKSRFGGRIDLLNHGLLFYFEKSDEHLVTIQNFDLFNSFRNIKAELTHSYRAMAIAELAYLMCQQMTPDRQLYKIFLAFLKALEAPGSDSHSLLVLFEMFAIHHEGYTPPLDSCRVCRAPPTYPLQWLRQQGTLMCQRCYKPGFGSAIEVSAEFPSLFKAMMSPDVKSLNRLTINPKLLPDMELFCFEYLRFHLDFQSRTENIFRFIMGSDLHI